MQIANVVHMIAGAVRDCLLLGHVYLGTIGMKGAYDAMRTGYVDETWAREHHEYWYNEVKAGKVSGHGHAGRAGQHRVVTPGVESAPRIRSKWGEEAQR